MVVLSKPTGAGAPERNWADVKVVFDKKKAATLPERVEKKDAHSEGMGTHGAPRLGPSPP